jgi:hypothetical protein
MVGLPEVVWSKEEERDNMLLLPALLALLSPSLYIFYIRFRFTACYNALQEKALKKYNVFQHNDKLISDK